MKAKTARWVAVVGLLAGCAKIPTGVEAPSAAPLSGSYTMTSSYNAADSGWYRRGGGASISGSALLRTRGGDVKTCAGLHVHLIPDTGYAEELMLHSFGSPARGLRQQYARFHIVNLDPAFATDEQDAVCDAQGSFSFAHLAAGVYFLTAQVTWEAPSQLGMSFQGGEIMQKVTVHENEALRVVVTE